jgi:hypothetical protein
MHDEAREAEGEEFVVHATHLSSIPPPLRKKARRRLRPAQRAMVFGVLGVVCFGFFFGPLALRFGQSARIGAAGGEDLGDVGLADAAVTLGKAGLALHLAALLAAIPWVMFVVPLITGG